MHGAGRFNNTTSKKRQKTKKQKTSKSKTKTKKKQLHFHAIIICAVHEKSKKLFYDQIVNSY